MAMSYPSVRGTANDPGPGGRIVLGTIAALGTAALFYFGTGFAPAAVLTWLAPLPLLFIAPRLSAVMAAIMALLAYFLGTINEWGLFFSSPDEPVTVGLAISGGGAVLFALLTLLFRGLVLRGRPVLAVLAAPALWTGGLAVAVRYYPHGLTGTLASTQTTLPMLLQTASVTGFLGIEFLVLFVPCVLAALLAPGEVRGAARGRTLVLTVVLAALVLGGGALRLALAQPGGPAVNVALISTTNTTSAPDLASPAGSALLNGYANAVSAVPAGTELVVLPERSFTVNRTSLGTLVGKLGPVASERDLTVVVGVAETSGSATTSFALRIQPDGKAVNPQLAGARLGVENGTDVDFTNPSRSEATGGARVLAIPAADEGQDGLQHARTAQLRGVENGVGVAWSGRNGTVLVADGFGHVLASADTAHATGQFVVVHAAIPPNPGTTLYNRFGDWFGWFSLGLALLGVIFAFVPSFKRGTSDGGSGADQSPSDLVGSGT